MDISIELDAQSITIPHQTGFTYNYEIDYGDGTVLPVTSYNDPNCTHTYEIAGDYRVTISGTCESIYINNSGTLRTTVRRILTWGNIGLKIANFFACNGLVSMNTIDSYSNLSGINNYQNSFRNTAISIIPAGMFDYSVNVSANAFTQTFSSCSSISYIPTDLFKYNVNVSNSGFQGTFNGCTSLKSIPVDLFRYNVNVSTSGFQNTFTNCNKVTQIPVDLFRYNTMLTTNAFYQTFQQCSSITIIPDDLFRYNTGVTSGAFQGTFQSCTSLTTIPTDLFRYNTAVTTNAFYQSKNNMFWW